MILTLRPIEQWPWPETQHRGSSKFRSSWTAIERLLLGETEKISASQVILQIDVMERDIRVDGWIRGNARPFSPRVAITIERYHEDTLGFHCDTYADWQDNVYAIAMTLKALRAIDRYGVTSAGEQYTGWKALTDGTMSREDAAELLARMSDHSTHQSLLADSESERQRAFKAARIAAHPDAGGSHEVFVKVEEAGRVLGLTS